MGEVLYDGLGTQARIHYFRSLTNRCVIENNKDPKSVPRHRGLKNRGEKATFDTEPFSV